jgi:hypothetical protein
MNNVLSPNLYSEPKSAGLLRELVEMQYTCVTVHLVNKDKNLKGLDKISDRRKNAILILNSCNCSPSRVIEHVYNERLTELEIEYHFEDLNVDEAENKLYHELKCFERSLGELSLVVSDISSKIYRM